jgi:serine protease Do
MAGRCPGDKTASGRRFTIAISPIIIPNMITRTFAALAIFALAGGIFFGLIRNRDGYGLDDLLAGRKPEQGEKYTPAESPVLKPDDVPLLERLNAENTRLIAAVTPSVVSVNTTRVIRGRTLTLDAWGGPRVRERSIAQTGLGSGVIVSKEGHVLTNFHVVEGVDEIQVTTFDGTKSLATKIGEDQDNDIAVLKIQNPKIKSYPALPFADSDSVKVGEAVWAIGNPFGLSESVTQGIISHRDRQFSDRDPPKFQTDAVINPGNSGGPLVNTRGEILGINVAIFSGQQNVHVWQGVGFAIPANDAKRAFRRIMQIGSPGGREPVGYLGLSADNAAEGDKPAVVITDVVAGSPADKVGIKAGDHVVKFGGRGVVDAMDFLRRINNYPVGEVADVVVNRDGLSLTFKPTVVDREAALTAEERVAERRDLRELIGIEVQDMTSSVRARRYLPENFAGVVVSDVEPGSPAAERGGLALGDVIYEVNGIPIDSVEKFFSIINSLKGKTFMARIVRRGYSYRVEITL